MKRLLILPLAISLAGCSFGFAQKDYVSRAETIPVRAEPASVGAIPVQGLPPVEDAAAQARSIATLLLPDGAGAILRVREKHFVNGTRQEIVIAADKGVYGENVIDVHIRTSEASPRHANPMTIGPPSENGIRNEILSRFPDVQMNIVTRPMRNGLGPFGLAIGRHPSGARCVFAWQWVDDLREATPGTSSLAKMNALMAGRGLATSIRIRLCRSDSTVDQLAAHIEGLRTGSASALERLAGIDRRSIDGEPVAANGSRSAPLLKPVTPSLEAAIAKPAARPSPQRSARATPPRAAPQPRPSRQAQRRAHVRQAEPAPQPAWSAAQQPVYAPPPQMAPPGPTGQRFLAPVAGMSSPAYGASAPAARAPGGAIALPPEAFRGPGASVP